MTGPTEQLILDRVTKQFTTGEGEALDVLRDVSCRIKAGETVAVVGPSGSGKSTLLNIIGGLEKPTSGGVRLGSTDVVSLQGVELASFRAQRVGFVFQEHGLLQQLSAVENVLLPTLALPGDLGAPERALELVERMGLSGRANAFPGQMSGGERQRVAVARALINGASLLLCDEPTGNLDRVTGARVVSLLMELAQQQGATVIMVTHNAEQAARFGRCLHLVDGVLAPDDMGGKAGGAP